MKAIKKDFYHLTQVVDSIVDSTISYVHHVNETENSIKVCFPACSSISSSVLKLIPCNYSYRIVFEYNNVYLIISYE